MDNNQKGAEGKFISSRHKNSQNPSLKFASKLGAELNDMKSNLFFSPFSLLSALGMCNAGAKGRTHRVLSKLLEVPADATEQKAYFKSLTSEVNSKEKRLYELVSANALWAQKGLGFNQEYSETVQNDYGGAFLEVDYQKAPDVAVKKINDWCSEQTRTKIPEIITRDFVNSDTQLILTNAIYFKGKWKTQFSKEHTTDEEFHSVETKKIPTMHLKAGFNYFENEAYQALEMPYEGDNLSMLIVLPQKNSVDGIKYNLEEVYNKATEGLHHEKKVVVSLPKFKLSTQYNLGDAFRNLGADLAFDDEADFSGITKQERLKISEVIHKAFVEVDEEGTEAAAATAVGIIRTVSFKPDRQVIFKVDRPFLFFIRNRDSGNILFFGNVVNL